MRMIYGCWVNRVRFRPGLLPDSIVNLQSIVDFVEQLRAKNKIVILDCCFAGNIQLSGRGDLTFEEIVSVFAGRGIAVMASSAADEKSWLSENKDASIYTKIAAAAISSRRNIHKGYLYILRQYRR